MAEFKLEKVLPIRPRIDPEKLDQKMRNASKLYEKHFLREMLKAMRKTVKHSEMTKPGLGESIYRQKLDEEYVEAWGDKGGIGLGELIYQQIKSKVLGNRMMPAPSFPIQQKGKSFDLPKEEPVKPIKLKSQNQQPHSAQFNFEIPTGNYELISPWDAQLVKKFSSGDLRQTLVLDHGQGLQSTLSFVGQMQPVNEGAHFSKGNLIGEVKSLDSSLAWKLNT